MLTPEEIDYLIGYLTALGGESQLLLQTFLILIYNNSEFGAWVYDIYQNCNYQLAAELISSAIEKYIEQHITPLNP